MRSHRTKTKVLACAGAALAAATLPTSASAAPASATAASARPPSATRVVVVDCMEHPRVRPHDFMLACGDGNNALTSLRWSHWRSTSAVGTGRDVVNDCIPYCAAGRFHSYRVSVRLDHPRPWAHHPRLWHYTRLHLTYVGARPAHTPRVETFELWN